MPVVLGHEHGSGHTGVIETSKAKRLHAAVSKRIMELDDDVETLKERREWGWISTKEITQINRLIKLFEATIKVLQKQL